MELCDASSRDAPFFFSLEVYHHYFLLLQYPVYPLFRLLSPVLSGPQSSPFLVALAFPPFLLLARAYVRAPSDFFPVFTHRSFFPFRNIIGDAMHLSPFPSPPSGPPRSPASPGEDRAAPLAHPASPTSANPGRVPATR